MNSDATPPVRSKGPSAAERAWRDALRQAGYQVAPTSIAVHPSQLNNPAADKRGAEAAYAEFVAAEPDNLMALDGLAFLLQHRGDWPGSLAVRRQRYAVEARQLGVAEQNIASVVDFLASSLGDGAAPVAVPQAYVAALFDDTAACYDEHLTGNLEYRGPDLLQRAVADVLGPQAAGLDILDLGCGTGLAGVPFRPIARRLTGVDLSQRMLERARERGIYDELHQSEIVAFVHATEQRHDLIIAADVFNYLGDLSPVLSGAARVLRGGGWLAVTIESGIDGDFRLRGKRRYQHGRHYLERTAQAAGLAACRIEEVELRQEMGEPVRAWCGVWQAPGVSA